ncbi:MAG: CpsD/CapB family tyrosine-protein kinase [Christensenellaceae bacterium]|nr:CpsD/CapB family tyrosine-protein kinase [Christensenellaceae bacterium]
MEFVSIKDRIAKEFMAAEAIKRLRTNVIFSGADVKTVGLTSCYESDGKSTISFNLAASLAQTGRHVVLLDTDLRRSVLMRNAVHNSHIYGLGHYLSGIKPVDNIIYGTDVPDFDIIFAGARVPNPAELLGSNRFSSLVKALRDSYDYIIVDTPPLGRVVDCAVMLPLLDGILMVINAERNRYKVAQNIKAQIEQANGKIIGVVLNKVNFEDKRSYYGDYGGKYGKYGDKYGYGYGYGYYK